MKGIVEKHKSGVPVGICSVCSAHPMVIEASLLFDIESDRKVLIEATSNQVNQYGGYTGMTPVQFRDYVYAIAQKVGFPEERLILGGDHLGPNCWKDEPAESAMQKSEILVTQYVMAGFSKIHLDTSMSCAGDPVPLEPEVVAERAARLCKAAEYAATEEQKKELCYVIGTEVPVPGGEKESITSMHVTTAESALDTINTHYKFFREAGLNDAIERVIAVVVQPGVEFDHSSVVHYQPALAHALSKFIEGTQLVFEAHSTDYQTESAYKALVRDHFAILKVGPALTFAMREALYSLSMIENELVLPGQRSEFIAVINKVMLDEPQYWKDYYSKTFSRAAIDRHYSLSDRVRYYWPHSDINHAVEKMLDNLSQVEIPLGMISQFFPEQFQNILSGQTEIKPEALIIKRIQNVLALYSAGCNQSMR
ncbi:tagatose-bisphosphate aldolase subunit GatZ [Klebsiella variicola]|uniref:tagatose-bisphosphate aldolase subunit GatZ n=1 Tax=Klebsiella variicola TaxID=244366 RepID=UPI0017DE2D71|nr:tagatose-bisphosphate aldolase subunit GatZ [Klebsiella variicola]EAV1661745.1 tagatose-bisphosphate aldolase subunit GatZ [Salmonella enterica]EFE1488249.1 tagatose-bisphosphate aldolase subunit GatZ [Escherichia coli]HDK8413716.1 tagatose-bisphosphate aldolase subunit GatZ [Klebsiella pneumoniae]EEL9623354.1 tagatose-bisphosphate aldolase subunit GatZ [Salmonella enterica]ELW6259104.1 tagatose-bisphosphate aldolase subunit GatZ [Escherichia coli]